MRTKNMLLLATCGLMHIIAGAQEFTTSESREIQMSFAQCEALIEMTSKNSNVKPIELESRENIKIVKWSMEDGDVFITCSGRQEKAIVTLKANKQEEKTEN